MLMISLKGAVYHSKEEIERASEWIGVGVVKEHKTHKHADEEPFKSFRKANDTSRLIPFVVS